MPVKKTQTMCHQNIHWFLSQLVYLTKFELFFWSSNCRYFLAAFKTILPKISLSLNASNYNMTAQDSYALCLQDQRFKAYWRKLM